MLSTVGRPRLGEHLGHRDGRRRLPVGLGAAARRLVLPAHLPRDRAGPRPASGPGCWPGGSSARPSDSSRGRSPGWPSTARRCSTASPRASSPSTRSSGSPWSTTSPGGCSTCRSTRSGVSLADLRIEGRLRDVLAGDAQVDATGTLTGTRRRRPARPGGHPPGPGAGHEPDGRSHKDGRHLGSVTTLRDRTELANLEREIGSFRSSTELLRAQAHEFANQLHTISGLIQIGEYDEVVRYVDAVSRHRESLDLTVNRRVRDTRRGRAPDGEVLPGRRAPRRAAGLRATPRWSGSSRRTRPTSPPSSATSSTTPSTPPSGSHGRVGRGRAAPGRHHRRDRRPRLRPGRGARAGAGGLHPRLHHQGRPGGRARHRPGADPPGLPAPGRRGRRVQHRGRRHVHRPADRRPPSRRRCR